MHAGPRAAAGAAATAGYEVSGRERSLVREVSGAQATATAAERRLVAARQVCPRGAAGAAVGGGGV